MRTKLCVFLCVAAMLSGCSAHSTYFDPEQLTDIPPQEKSLVERNMTDRFKRIASARLLYDVTAGSQQMKAACVFNGVDQVRVELFPASLAVSSALMVKNHNDITIIQQLENKRMSYKNFDESMQALIGIPVSEQELMLLFTGSLDPKFCTKLQSLDASRAVCSTLDSIMLISKNTGRILSLEHFGSVGQLRLRAYFPSQIGGGEEMVPDAITIELPRYNFSVELSLASSAFNKPVPDKLFILPAAAVVSKQPSR